MHQILKNALGFSKLLISSVIKQGDTVIDATAGNGKDTLFLAEKVGPNGRVFSFDIQQVSIDKTRQLLIANKMEKRVILIKSGHENLESYINMPVKAAMFNLGYLPGGDHSIITKPDTTIKAIKACLGLLEHGGLITIVIYTGHPGGNEEKKEIFDFTSTLEQTKFNVISYCFINQKNNPPQLVAIEKL
ncbi:MAG: hypothetical protein PWP21_153 [Thermosediminibacterales bacterium]|nr:hypothetical protein [Thermosediminibacterales bacterium]